MLRIIEFFLIRWTTLARSLSWVTLAAVLALTAAAGYVAATRLKVNTDTSAMLDPSLPFQQKALALRTAFPDIKSDVVIIIEGKTLDETEAFTSALRDQLLAQPDVFASVFAPSADPFFLQNGLLYLDDAELGDRLDSLSDAAGLIETLVKTPTAGALFTTLADNDALAEKADIGQETLQDIYGELARVIDAGLEGGSLPFDWQGALSPQNDDADAPGVHRRFVYTSPALDFTRLQPAKPALRALDRDLDNLTKGFDGRIETFVTGDPALRADELQSVTTGIGLSFGLSFILVAILLFSAYRSAYLSIITLMSLIITIVLTAAFAALVVQELNLVSVAFTVLLVGLGLDFAIHLLLHVQERRGAGQSIRRSLRGAVHNVGAALALAAPTTAIGFFAFIPTRFDGIAQLGLIAGVGVFIAFAVAVTFLPAALGAITPPPPKKRSGAVRGVFGALEKVSIAVSLLTILLGAWAVTLLPQARFDADPMSLRDPSSPSVRGFQRLFEDPDTAPYRLTRLVKDEAEAERTADAAKALPTVQAVRSLASFIPENQDDKLDRIDIAAGSLAFALDAEPSPETGPEMLDAAAVLQARLAETYGPETEAAALARALTSLTAEASRAPAIEDNIFRYWDALTTRLFEQLNADKVDLDALPAHLKRRYRSETADDDGALWRVDMLPAEDVRNPRALAAFVTDVEATFPDIAGGAVQAQKAGAVISNAMLQATSLALGFILIFLWVTLRRFSDVAMMMFPLILAAVLTTATGVLFDIPFNYANVIVLPLLVGIGIDSGIHLVMRDRHVEDDGSVFGTSTPRAVFFSALTTVASFGSLMLSPHRGTASMGQLLSIAIAFTLVCTLIVLPAALKLRGGQRRGR
ncbi:MAG: MMPL family transporter [Pseudomonadota bacterium]